MNFDTIKCIFFRFAGHVRRMSADDNLSHDRLHQARDPPLGKINTEFFALPNLPGLNDFDPGDNNRDSRQMCADDPWCQDEYVANRTTDQLLPTDHHHNHPPDGVDYGISHHLERHSWVVPMLALAAVNVLVLVTFEVYVVCKASRNTPSRRHLFLGKGLLLLLEKLRLNSRLNEWLPISNFTILLKLRHYAKWGLFNEKFNFGHLILYLKSRLYCIQ